MLVKTLFYKLLIVLFSLTLLYSSSLAEEPGKFKHVPGKGFTVNSEDGEFNLTVGGLIQLRHTYVNFDDDRDPELNSESTFAAQRIRIWLKGKFFQDWRYKFQADFGKGNSNLKDSQIEWTPDKKVNLSFGQFKVCFDRQQKISSSNQTFVDRSIAAQDFGINRDIGIQLYGASKSDFLQYNFGIFNGEGEGKSNPNDGHLFVGRISFNPHGNFGFSESDIKKSSKHLYYIDLGTAFHNKRIIDGTKTNDTRYVVGFGYRHAGIYWQNEYYMRELDQKGSPGVDSNGWYSQIGFVIQPETWEFATRYSIIDPNHDLNDDKESEAIIGINRFFRKLGHAFKFTWDIGHLTKQNSPGIEYEDICSHFQLQIIY